MKKCRICHIVVEKVSRDHRCSDCDQLEFLIDIMTPSGINYFYGYIQRRWMNPKDRRKIQKCQCQSLSKHRKGCNRRAEFKVRTPYGDYFLCNTCVAERHMIVISTEKMQKKHYV